MCVETLGVGRRSPFFLTEKKPLILLWFQYSIHFLFDSWTIQYMRLTQFGIMFGFRVLWIRNNINNSWNIFYIIKEHIYLKRMSSLCLLSIYQGVWRWLRCPHSNLNKGQQCFLRVISYLGSRLGEATSCHSMCRRKQLPPPHYVVILTATAS